MEEYLHRIRLLSAPTYLVRSAVRGEDDGDDKIGLLYVENNCKVVGRIPYAKDNLGKSFPRNFKEAVYQQPILWKTDEMLHEALLKSYFEMHFNWLSPPFTLYLNRLTYKQVYYVKLFIETSGYFIDCIDGRKLSVLSRDMHIEERRENPIQQSVVDGVITERLV